MMTPERRRYILELFDAFRRFEQERLEVLLKAAGVTPEEFREVAFLVAASAKKEEASRSDVRLGRA